LFTLRTLLNAVICRSQLNTQRVLGRHLESGLLVIDAVGLRFMYFVVMPRVNLIMILMTYVRYLYSINCPTVICLPSMLLFILWRDTTSELWTTVHSFTLLLLFTIYSLYLHSCNLLPFTTRYAQSFVYSKPVRLTTSLRVGTKYLVVLCAGSTLLLVKSYTPTSFMAPLSRVLQS
jgi:hypothetical protein